MIAIFVGAIPANISLHTPQVKAVNKWKAGASKHFIDSFKRSADFD